MFVAIRELCRQERDREPKLREAMIMGNSGRDLRGRDGAARPTKRDKRQLFLWISRIHDIKDLMFNVVGELCGGLGTLLLCLSRGECVLNVACSTILPPQEKGGCVV